MKDVAPRKVDIYRYREPPSGHYSSIQHHFYLPRSLLKAMVELQGENEEVATKREEKVTKLFPRRENQPGEFLNADR